MARGKKFGMWRVRREQLGRWGITENYIIMEESILNSVKNLLLGWVNEGLGEVKFLIPPIEFSHTANGRYYAVTPELRVLSRE
jgi:hypothetical protein